jgi:hypothetical protein
MPFVDGTEIGKKRAGPRKQAGPRMNRSDESRVQGGRNQEKCRDEERNIESVKVRPEPECADRAEC